MVFSNVSKRFFCDLIYKCDGFFPPWANIRTYGLISVSAFGEGRIEIRIDLEKTWSQYLWIRRGRDWRGAGKAVTSRENGLAAELWGPRDFSWRGWGVLMVRYCRGTSLQQGSLGLKAIHMGSDLNTLFPAGGWMLYLLWERFLTPL